MPDKIRYMNEEPHINLKDVIIEKFKAAHGATRIISTMFKCKRDHPMEIDIQFVGADDVVKLKTIYVECNDTKKTIDVSEIANYDETKDKRAR